MSSQSTVSLDKNTLRQRLEKAQNTLADSPWDALVIGPGPDLFYYLGSRLTSHERFLALVVPRQGTPFIVAPKLEAPGIHSPLVDDVIPVLTWEDGEDPYGLLASKVEGRTTNAVAVDESMTARHVIPLSRLFDSCDLGTELIATQRMVKDEAELEALRRAGQAIDRVHARMSEFLAVGRTEAEVGELISAAMIEEGHSTVEFVIVGSGPFGADPHHDVSDRVIEAGDIVVIDIGGAVEPGYFSDCTRTYSLGAPTDTEAAELIGDLVKAQAAATAHVQPGVSAESIDAAARDYLRGVGLDSAFIHRTGHGIGLSVHEEPYIVSGNSNSVLEGYAFSIEPGIYFPGRFGARIEDIVVVTAEGVESLNNQPHGLTEIPL